MVEFANWDAIACLSVYPLLVLALAWCMGWLGEEKKESE